MAPHIAPASWWHIGMFRGSKAERRLNLRDLRTLDTVAALCPQRRVVVQAGGNLGIFPKRLAMLFETVYTFEPDPDLFAILKHNAPEPNIVAIQKALSDSDASVGLSRVRRDGKPHSHEGCTHVTGPGDIPAQRLDELGLMVCDLICLDIEGHERQALTGAIETIERCRPVLCVEVNKNQGFVGSSESELRAFILGLGYGLVRRMVSDEIFVPLTMEDAA